MSWKRDSVGEGGSFVDVRGGSFEKGECARRFEGDRQGGKLEGGGVEREFREKGEGEARGGREVKFALKRDEAAYLRGRVEREAFRGKGDDESRHGNGGGGRREGCEEGKDETGYWCGKNGSGSVGGTRFEDLGRGGGTMRGKTARLRC